ncbi:MAG: M4 family metallopeptidase [Bacteroidota bacterium]
MKKFALTRLTIVLLLLVFYTSYLLAQNDIFFGDFTDQITEDSRPGWIKFKSDNVLSVKELAGSLNSGLNLSEDFAFEQIGQQKDDIGAARTIYQTTYQGVAVEHHHWLFHERFGQLTVAQGHAKPNMADVAAKPSLSEEAALFFVLSLPKEPQRFDTLPQIPTPTKYAWDDPQMERDLKLVTGNSEATHFPKATLLWTEVPEQNEYTLAYAFDIYTLEPLAKKRYYVDAHSRRLIKTVDLMLTNCFAHDHGKHTSKCRASTNVFSKKRKIPKKRRGLADTPALGKANYVSTNNGIVNFTTQFTGTDYILRANNLGPDNNQVVHTLSANNNDNTSNLTEIRDVDNDWQDDSTAVGAHWGTEKVYDYFLTKHNRKSFDGNGAPLLSYVNYGTNYVNAFWNGVNMTYGDGNGDTWGALTSLDVIAHEIAHGVTENNGLGGLVYSYESGALNESFSDIFGVVFEFAYDPDGGDWLMGEDFDFVNQEGFRSMSNPNDKGDPKTYYGQLWHTEAWDFGGVHINSGVQNFWFYLLVNGGSGTNEYQYDYNVTGIGMDDAAAIAYRNLTTYMSPRARFIDARDGAIQSAIDLFGENSQQHLSTLEAWCAVGVGTTCLPQITVTQPVLNQVETNGTTLSITWSNTGETLLSKVKLEYALEIGNEVEWHLIENGVDNDGTYEWTIPNIAGTSVRIRVSDSGDPNIPRLGNPLILDESPYFTIQPCLGTISFDGPTEAQLNELLNFTGLVSGDSFEWLVDGISVATSKDLSYTFTELGVHELTYIVENQVNNCFNRESRSFLIIPDDVCKAYPILLDVTYDGLFTGATTEANEPKAPGGNCRSQRHWCNDNLHGSVWYSFTAPASGMVNIRTEGSDSKIALYAAIDCDAPNPFQNAQLIAANDDNPARCCGALISNICLTPNVTYHIQVDQYLPNQGPFTLTVENIEAEIYPADFQESLQSCRLQDNWRFIPGNGQYTGISQRGNCLDCTFEVGSALPATNIIGTAYLEVLNLDFNSATPTIFSFDYAYVPQNDTMVSQLTVEIGGICESYSTIYHISGTAMATNDGSHSNGESYIPNCTELRSVSIDMASLDITGRQNLRISVNGHFRNPVLIDNLFLGVANDTCRLLDSLVLVDMYNALNGPNWTYQWDLTEPLDSFYGVTLSQFGCVERIELDGYFPCSSCPGGGNNLSGSLPVRIGDLRELTFLSLANDNITGTIPSSIGNLTNLRELHLQGLELNGAVPTEIGQLIRLDYLTLSSNKLSIVPQTLNNLSNLTRLHLDNNEFITLPYLGDLTNLIDINISRNPFNTEIPSWVSKLTKLGYFNADNCGWIGSFPDLSSMTTLYYIRLENNHLQGQIPDLSTATQLSSIYVSNNQLSGNIPNWLRNLSNLRIVELSGNEFNGTVPSFASASYLSTLHIHSNKFTFEDLLPNFSANKTLIDGNKRYSWQGFGYNPQDSIGMDSSQALIEGNNYTFDLAVDASISDNEYKWFKDGNPYTTIMGSNRLTITNATNADLGTYTCEVTNPNAPDLTLHSRNYRLVESSPSLPCDLVIFNPIVDQPTCPDGEDGRISLSVASASGHRINYQLSDTTNNLLRNQNGGYFTDLRASNYTFTATSLDDTTCQSLAFIPISPKVDETPPPVYTLGFRNVALVNSRERLYFHYDYLVDHMNRVFAFDWQPLQYETVNANLLFSSAYNVIYLDGVDESALALSTFLDTHQQLIEDWVSEGNALYINISTYRTSFIDVGFNGFRFAYSIADSAYVVNPTHAILQSPNTLSTTAFAGRPYAYSYVDFGPLTANVLIESEDGNALLVETDWGDGKVIFSSLNPQWWMGQPGDMTALRRNILQYLKNNTQASAPPFGSSPIDLDANGMLNFAVSDLVVDAYDDCSNVNVGLSQSSFGCADIGQQSITFTATDEANNVLSFDWSFTISDSHDYCTGTACPESRNLDGIQMSGGFYRGTNIESNSTVMAGAFVAFFGEESITLKTGFHAVPGANLLARIEACPENLTEEEAAESRESLSTAPTLSTLSVRPNPFRNSAFVNFSLNEAQKVDLALFSMDGRQVQHIQRGFLDKGNYQEEIFVDNLQGGMYFIILQTETEVFNQKVITLE